MDTLTAPPHLCGKIGRWDYGRLGERRELFRRWRAAGHSKSAIARAAGLSQPAIRYALDSTWEAPPAMPELKAPGHLPRPAAER